MKKIFLCFLYLSSLYVCAQDKVPHLIYLSVLDLKVREVLPPVPHPGDAIDKKDFDELFFYQTNRTENDCKRAAFVENANIENFFGEPYGTLSEIEIKKINSFFKKISLDAGYFIALGKTLNLRLRPYLSHRDIIPCIRKEATSAYPSGHSAAAKLFALILSDLFPRHGTEFLRRADEISLDRVVGGVHHPSDTRAGKILGEEIYKKLSQNKKFKRELKIIKESL